MGCLKICWVNGKKAKRDGHLDGHADKVVLSDAFWIKKQTAEYRKKVWNITQQQEDMIGKTLTVKVKLSVQSY